MKFIGNFCIVLGVVLSLIGLYYQLGETDSFYFQYAYGIGIILFGIGILLDGISGISKKK